MATPALASRAAGATRSDVRTLPTALATVVSLVDVFDEPVYVLRQDASIVHANPAAKRRFTSTPSWLNAAASDPKLLGDQGAMTRVTLDGQSFVVIVVRARRSDERSKAARALPSYLRPVGERLARGMSDKEIACELELSISTVRTYVTRCYRHLGVRGRRELMLAWKSKEEGPFAELDAPTVHLARALPMGTVRT